MRSSDWITVSVFLGLMSLVQAGGWAQGTGDPTPISCPEIDCSESASGRKTSANLTVAMDEAVNKCKADEQTKRTSCKRKMDTKIDACAKTKGCKVQSVDLPSDDSSCKLEKCSYFSNGRRVEITEFEEKDVKKLSSSSDTLPIRYECEAKSEISGSGKCVPDPEKEEEEEKGTLLFQFQQFL